MKKNVTVKEFIQDYLVKQIGEIKDEHPYLAFVLIAVALEFLGKCMNNHRWNDTKHPKSDFETPLKYMNPRYGAMDLYHNLRCNLAHTMRIWGITLSDTSGKVNADLSVNDFFRDFEDICNKLVNGGSSVPQLSQEKLNEVFFEVEISNAGQSTSGNTQS